MTSPILGFVIPVGYSKVNTIVVSKGVVGFTLITTGPMKMGAKFCVTQVLNRRVLGSSPGTKKAGTEAPAQCFSTLHLEWARHLYGDVAVGRR